MWHKIKSKAICERINCNNKAKYEFITKNGYSLSKNCTDCMLDILDNLFPKYSQYKKAMISLNITKGDCIKEILKKFYLSKEEKHEIYNKYKNNK